LSSSDDEADDEELVENEIQIDNIWEGTAEDRSDQGFQQDLILPEDDEVMSNMSEESQRSSNVNMKSECGVSSMDKGAIDDYLSRSNEDLETAVGAHNEDFTLSHQF
jgi:hypothetical protein